VLDRGFDFDLDFLESKGHDNVVSGMLCLICIACSLHLLAGLQRLADKLCRYSTVLDAAVVLVTDKNLILLKVLDSIICWTLTLNYLTLQPSCTNIFVLHKELRTSFIEISVENKRVIKEFLTTFYWSKIFWKDACLCNWKLCDFLSLNRRKWRFIVLLLHLTILSFSKMVTIGLTHATVSGWMNGLCAWEKHLILRWCVKICFRSSGG